MGGFKNSLLNAVFKKNLFDITISALINGCSSMVDDCKKNHKLLPNHEEKIRNHLIENYLNDMDKRKSLGLGKFPVRFISEVLEGYDESTYTYSGRTDIRVVSNNWFNNSDDYYTVECKRLDGSNDLNKKYVIEGVCRFAIDPPKYPSHNKKNIMLGFIVKRINESILLSKINRIHNAKLSSRKIGEISYVDLGTDYKICESAYIDGLQISHIFYDISTVI